jgi:hypothetical protein
MNVRERSYGRSFPPSVWNQVPPSTVQAQFRQVFGLWGRPERLRLDNGLPWANWNDLPTALALWLVGLGVDLLFNPPRQPQYNGVVEKSQDTGQRWCEPHTCQTAGELQTRLDAMDRLQREAYPSLQGRSRLQVFPELRPPRRPYSEGWEQATWDLRRAQDYLAGFVAVRQANQQGQVSIYARRVSVGARYRGQAVVVQYEADAQAWLLTDAEGRLLREVAAPEICRERIVAVEIAASRTGSASQKPHG